VDKKVGCTGDGSILNLLGKVSSSGLQKQSYWAGMYYEQQRAKGKSHQLAVRALAYKWVRIVYRCWKTRTAYDEASYLKALKETNSPLLAA
jgi:hypothetical protein